MLIPGAKKYHQQMCPFCGGQKLFYVDREFNGVGTRRQSMKVLFQCDSCDGFFSEVFPFERQEICALFLHDLKGYCLDPTLQKAPKIKVQDITEFLK
jgi:rubredoxin